MNKINPNFATETILQGMDIHKSRWNVGIYLNDMFIKNVPQKLIPSLWLKPTLSGRSL